jgi:hypothetical protein
MLNRIYKRFLDSLSCFQAIFLIYNSFSYETIDGTATKGEDYVEAKGVLEFREKETQKSITVEIIDDDQWEPDETFFVKLFLCVPRRVFWVLNMYSGPMQRTRDASSATDLLTKSLSSMTVSKLY